MPLSETCKVALHSSRVHGMHEQTLMWVLDIYMESCNPQNIAHVETWL